MLSGEDELKLISGPARVDIFILFVCTEGKFQVNVNMSTIVVSEGNVLLCKPNDLIDENVFFPGFQGYVLCLSPQIIRECVPGDSLWKQAFRHRDKSVIQVRKPLKFLRCTAICFVSRLVRRVVAHVAERLYCLLSGVYSVNCWMSWMNVTLLMMNNSGSGMFCFGILSIY